jgi:hypothetical protein
MRQLLVLTAADWTTLRQGGSISFHIGEETYGLITEAVIQKVWNRVPSSNGATPPPPPAKNHRHRFRKHYTVAEKREILAALEKAHVRGQTQREVLIQFGVPPSSSAPYLWRRQLDAKKK